MRLPIKWPAASLRTYLVLVTLLATVPIAVLMSWQIFSSLRDQDAQLEARLRRSAAVVKVAVQHEIESTTGSLHVIARHEALRRGDLPAFERQLVDYRSLRSSWSGLVLLAPDGRVLAGSNPGRLPVLPPLPPDAPMRVSNLLPDRSTLIEVPVRIDDALRYRLVAVIDAAVWQHMIDSTQLASEDSFVTLSDGAHRVVARSPEGGLVGQPLPVRGAEMLDGREPGMQRTPGLQDEAVYVAWQGLPDTPWHITAGVRADPLDQAQQQAVISAVLTAGGCLLLGVTLALGVARRISQPLRALAEGGPAGAVQAIPVREIARLRDALLAADAQDAAARARLQNKADEFETLFNSSPIGLAFAQDAACRSVLHNRAMNELFGEVGAAGRPGTVRVLHRGQRLERMQQPLHRAAAEGVAVTDMELELLIDERPARHVIAHAVPLRDAAGKPRGAIGALVDITERKLAETQLIATDRRLLESQRLVNLAQEAGGVGFFHYRFEADAASWTPGQAKLFGFGTMPFEGSVAEWLQRVHEDDRATVQQVLRDALAAKRERETLEFRVIMPDGAVRWLSARVLIGWDEQGAPMQITGVTVDVTVQKESERERAALIEREQAARLEAEAASRAKDEFLAMLGHELRNPLSAISSAVEVLNRVDATSELAGNARDIMARQTRHLARLMDDLLDVARVISGKVMLSRHPLDLSALAGRVASTLEMTGDVREHVLETDLHEVWVDADITRLEQVVNNLVTNALKYTPAGGRVAIRVAEQDGQAVLEVRDSGVGISPALLPRIFDLFVQGERTLDRRAGGLGIGLTLVRRLVELHGGTVTATSSPQGSVFTVRLPCAQAPLRAQVQQGLPLARRRRVVVVEDNEDALATLRALLELDGHSVQCAGDGESGLQLVLQTRPDVAVIDIGLPGLTGYEVARRSRAGGHAGRMIAVSGYGQDKDVRQALVSGFDAHLVKPVNAEELRRLIADD